MTNWYNDLIETAFAARKHAYAPYSGISVGAALLCSSNRIFSGANIENAAYPAGICAERVAFTQALFTGEREFSAIAIVGGQIEQAVIEYFYPCGICRQWMAEFCIPNFIILAAKNETDFQESQLSLLLPYSFGPSHLK
jgi:homotetrameric cytidine deaminase